MTETIDDLYDDSREDVEADIHEIIEDTITQIKSVLDDYARNERMSAIARAGGIVPYEAALKVFNSYKDIKDAAVLIVNRAGNAIIEIRDLVNEKCPELADDIQKIYLRYNKEIVPFFKKVI